MTREQKHRVSMDITGTLNRISFYKTAIDKVVKNKKMFHSGSIEIKILSHKTIWEELTADECLSILRRKMREQKGKLLGLEKLIK